MPTCTQPQSLFPELITFLPLKRIPALLAFIICTSVSQCEDVLRCVLHAEPGVSRWRFLKVILSNHPWRVPSAHSALHRAASPLPHWHSAKPPSLPPPALSALLLKTDRKSFPSANSLTHSCPIPCSPGNRLSGGLHMASSHP